VIGKGGASVKQIRESSGATVKMDPDNGTDRIVTLGGGKDAVVSAAHQILEIVGAMPPGQGNAPPKRQAVTAPGHVPGYPTYGAAYGAPQSYAAPHYAVPSHAYSAQQPQAYANPYAQYQQAYQPPPAAPPAGGATAELPSAELVQLVNQDGAGRLIGRSGAGIKELRSMYPRAHINISTEAEPGSDYRKVTVTGQLEDVQAAIGGILHKLANLK